jgi:signal transduction histidine kinase
MKRFFGFRSQHKVSAKLNNLMQLEAAVNAMLSIDQLSIRSDFFESIAQSLHLITGGEIVIIGKFDASFQNINTLAYWEDEQIKPPQTIALEGTPCQTVIGSVPKSYPSGIIDLFPDFPALKEKGIKAYVGVPLLHRDGSPIGIVAVLFAKPVEEYKIVESLLQLYAFRLVSEIEHIEDKQKLECQNEELNSLFEQLKSKNEELETAKAKAEESDQLKTSFLANLSHEIRTPMNVMLGFAELLKSDITMDERAEFISIINQNGMQLLKVMDNLIEISKFQVKSQLKNPKPVNINSVLQRLYRQYDDYLKMLHKPVQLILECELPNGDDGLMVDSDGISKIMDQVLDNAVKFTPSGYVKFGYNLVGSNVCFFVKDTGVGVPSGMEETIFELFRQADLRNSREFGGNGIGLAIARKYTHLLGGEIWTEPGVESGACFYVNIPTPSLASRFVAVPVSTKK